MKVYEKYAWVILLFVGLLWLVGLNSNAKTLNKSVYQ